MLISEKRKTKDFKYMQILFAISFGLILATSLFIGNALSGDYNPYAAFVAALLYLLSLFMPFISEYNVLHRGFSKIGDNFKTLMHSDERHQGDIEIIVPGESRGPAEQYNLNKSNKSGQVMLLIILIASALFVFDLVSFYFLGDGLKPDDTGPISNF